MKSTTFEEIAERRYRRELDSHMKPLLEIMEDERINDLAVNDDGAVYAQLRDGTKERIDIEIEPERIVTIGTLLAAKEDVDLNNNNPSISTKYPDPPLRVSITLSSATRARPVISVRRPSPQVFPLDDFVSKGICTAEEAEKLRRLVRERKNIIVSGETGSGKTTLINSLLLEIPPSDRLFIIQDVEEIQCLAPNKVQVLCSEGHYTQHGRQGCSEIQPGQNHCRRSQGRCSPRSHPGLEYRTSRRAVLHSCKLGICSKAPPQGACGAGICNAPEGSH